MGRDRTRFRHRFITCVVVIVTLVVCGGLLLKNYATPKQRDDIETALFTVGDENYAKALSEGKNIVKFGRLPFGVYPGGIAFDKPSDAWNYLREIGKEDQWRVYQLSGDFELDAQKFSDQHYTIHSLLVIKSVPKNPAKAELANQESNSGSVQVR